MRYRLCPWCLDLVISCLACCARCFSKFKSCGKFHRTAPPRESPLEVPRDDIAHVMEAATAAASSNANQAEKPDDDARTMAEPEMEIDNDDMVDENELDEEQQDPDANESQDEVAERRPILLQGNVHIIDPTLLKQECLCMCRTTPTLRTRTAMTQSLFPSRTGLISWCNACTSRG